MERTIEQIGTDRSCYSPTDYPHHHFEGQNALPDGCHPI